jgi:hypothetical protein
MRGSGIEICRRVIGGLLYFDTLWVNSINLGVNNILNIIHAQGGQNSVITDGQF